MKRVAVVLSGCGKNDGTEITEAVSLMIALSQAQVQMSFFAPDKKQMHVIDHQKGEEQKEERNVRTEAARITRGEVAPLDGLDATQFDALFVPGGFGAAKNLSDFAVKGGDFDVDPFFKEKVLAFHKQQKVIGACCISPLMLAKCFQESGSQIKVTLGSTGSEQEWPYQGTIQVAQALGSQVEQQDKLGVTVDTINRIVTTPAFMSGTAQNHEILEGIQKMVHEVQKLVV